MDFNFVMNDWQSIPIAGKLVPREADIKITLADGHKVVILCDGEAFHGPRLVFGDVGTKVQNDVATAKGYFSLGYSVVRYSETEIKTGWAEQHFRSKVSICSSTLRYYRTWHPLEELISNAPKAH